MTRTEWTEALTSELLRLWSQSETTARGIAEKLGGGLTANAIIGKANRMGLPLKSSGQPRLRIPRGRRRVKKSSSPVVKPPAETNPPAPEPAGGAGFGFQPCKWPEGDPATQDFRFCGQLTVQGKSYCDRHCKEAYLTGSQARGALKEVEAPKGRIPSYMMRHLKY